MQKLLPRRCALSRMIICVTPSASQVTDVVSRITVATHEHIFDADESDAAATGPSTPLA